MAIATVERISNEREGLIHIIGDLSDKAILKLKGYADRVHEEELEAIKAEIAALEAKYGTTPNAETIAAMEAARAGIGELVTLEQIQAECNALR
jgi:hypothetical protein